MVIIWIESLNNLILIAILANNNKNNNIGSRIIDKLSKV